MEIILAVLAIIGAISGLFKDKSETAEPVPKRKSAPPETVPKQTRRSDANPNEGNETQPTAATASIEEIQKKQREQLAERMDSGDKNQEEPEQQHDTDLEHHTGKPATDAALEQQKLKKNMRKNLSRSGLVNGIIMSEVLGQPRATKPYRSIIAQRKK